MSHHDTCCCQGNQVGKKVEDFTVSTYNPEEGGFEELTLSKLLEQKKWVVLVFYPADWSPVCGDELALFNEALPLLREKHATLVGISVDSVWCHRAFAEARHLHFDLLADFEPKGAVSRLYGAYDPAGFSRRALFVIDKDGTIAWSYLSPTAVNPGVDGVLDALAALPA